MGTLRGRTRDVVVILAAESVVDLQFFLMDAAKRYVIAVGGSDAAADDLLASAAALDYALLLASERADESLDDDAPVARSLRETMLRAATSALDLAERMLGSPFKLFADFAERHVRAGGVFDVLRALQKSDVVRSDDIAFRILTLTDDIARRRSRGF